MKKSIKKRLTRAASYSRTLLRLKHYRGRKVHSPFVYGIVRNAIMKTTPQGDERTLFDELVRRGFSNKRAAQLQNLYSFCGFTSAVFADGEIPAAGREPAPEGLKGNMPALDAGTLCFAMPSLSEAGTRALIGRAEGTGAALCFVAPYENRRRRRLARSLVAEHRHTSVDGRGFLLMFFNGRLPKQHFKL